MSRSFRAPWVKQGGCKRISKRFANKAWRNKKDVPDGMAYKLYFNSWNICDFRWRVNKPHRGCWEWRYLTYDAAVKEYRRLTRK